MGKDLTKLDAEISDALKPLSPRQRTFVENFATGGNSTQAALKAGYAERSARIQASRLMTNANYTHVQRAVDLLRERHALEHGLPAAWKRKVLANVAETASDVNGDGYVPSAAVRAVNEMNLMDGSHAPRQSHITMQSVNVDLHYQIDVPREKPIEGELIEEDPE